MYILLFFPLFKFQVQCCRKRALIVRLLPPLVLWMYDVSVTSTVTSLVLWLDCVRIVTEWLLSSVWTIRKCLLCLFIFTAQCSISSSACIRQIKKTWKEIVGSEIVIKWNYLNVYDFIKGAVATIVPFKTVLPVSAKTGWKKSAFIKLID